jgi:putative tryptophan/tyrosine transport system substrate-binding protein
MRRREFVCLIGCAATVWPVAGLAQRAAKAWRIGHVFPGPPSMVDHFADVFEQRLLSHFPDRDFSVVRRFPEPKMGDQAVRELVPDIDLLVTWTTIGSIAAKKYASDVIPCVFIAVGAPVDIGLVQSLSHPGGNMTGTTFEAATETYAKRLQILKEILPDLQRVAVLRTIGDPNVTFAMQSVERAAPVLKVDLQLIDIRTADGLPDAFEAMKKSDAQALLIISSAVAYRATKRIAELALVYQLPSCSPFQEHIPAGGLVALGPDLEVMAAQGADLVGKIIKGAKPGDLPVEQPTRCRLLLNLRTAKTLGLDVPLSLQQWADEVIE